MPEQISLPPLEKIACDAHCGPESSDETVLNLLRKAAVTVQNGSPVRFYSIRRVAIQFRKPASTVDQMFECLRTEGILTSIWGCGTFVSPASIDRHLGVRGVVVQLIPTAALTNSKGAAKLLAEVSTELWHRRFASLVWTYDDDQAADPSFCERVLIEKPDAIIWLLPAKRSSTLSYRLMNCGIPVIQAAAIAEIFAQLLG